MRLIDADKMLLDLDCERRMSCDRCPFYANPEFGCAIMDDEPIAKWIEAQPPVEAEPVRHGRWVVRLGPVLDYQCSECSARLPFGLTPETKFCPYCGAKMDGPEG